MNSSNLYPSLGLGVGLRSPHYADFFEEEKSDLQWVEIISENFMAWQHFHPQKPFETLEKVREKLPVAMHGVSLSIGSVDPLNQNYLKSLRDLEQKIQPWILTDHLCWTGVRGENLHDLLPLPYTEEAIQHIVNRLSQVQDFLGRQICIENVSSYVEFAHSEMPEWEFVKEIVQRSGCGLLLDINNVYVSSVNHRFDAKKYLEALPTNCVGQMHLAGHSNKGTYLIDTHDHPVCEEVWQLYAWACQRFGRVNTMIEWDDNVPSWQVLMAEVQKIKAIQDRAFGDTFAAAAKKGDACETLGPRGPSRAL